MIKRLSFLVVIVVIVFCCPACGDKETYNIQRAREPWAFRSVLDRQPRMLTLALNPECYVAYDLARCVFYKAWKGGVTMEGAAYTDKKNVQPTSWGTSYFADSTRPFKWIVETEGKKDSFRILNKGYAFLHNQIYLKFILIPSSKDTIHIEERPEFVQSKGKPAFERLFKTSGVPGNITISLQSGDTTFHLESNKTSRFIVHLKQLPEQFPPKQQEEYDHRGRYFMEKSDCFTCH